jgi:hypothetical protein
MPAMVKRRNSACPSEDCRGTSPPQRYVARRLADAGVEAEWAKTARRCSYCGCVYSISGSAKVVRGHLDNEVLGLGWRPKRV